MATAVLEDKTAVIEQAKALTVKTAPDRKKAADLWDAIRAFRKQEEQLKEDHCRPLKTAWDNAKVPHDTFIKECQGYETRLQGLMSTWDRERDRLARIEQDRLQAIVDKKNEKIVAKAEEKGIEPVLKVAPVVQAPERNITTQAGSVQNRVVRKVYGVRGVEDGADLKSNDPRIKDIMSAFPALFVFDWVAFRKVASSGMLDQCPQVEQREEYTYRQTK